MTRSSSSHLQRSGAVAATRTPLSPLCVNSPQRAKRHTKISKTKFKATQAKTHSNQKPFRVHAISTSPKSTSAGPSTSTSAVPTTTRTSALPGGVKQQFLQISSQNIPHNSPVLMRAFQQAAGKGGVSVSLLKQVLVEREGEYKQFMKMLHKHIEKDYSDKLKDVKLKLASQTKQQEVQHQAILQNSLHTIETEMNKVHSQELTRLRDDFLQQSAAFESQLATQNQAICRLEKENEAWQVFLYYSSLCRSLNIFDLYFNRIGLLASHVQPLQHSVLEEPCVQSDARCTFHRKSTTNFCNSWTHKVPMSDVYIHDDIYSIDIYSG